MREWIGERRVRKKIAQIRLSPDEVRAELQRILASNPFRGSPRHRRFLEFIVEETLAGRDGEIKESVVATEVFGRGTSFDPRTDSVVRVEARNLRSRLNEYYLGEGAADPVIVELPKGAYVPLFRAAVRPPVSGQRRYLRPAGVAVAAAVLVLCAAAWWFLKRGPAVRSMPPSIAVLPFVDLAGKAEEGYFADGVVEDLTTDLGSLPGLRVAARTSAFQFRGKNDDVREIGRKLGVGMLLEGSVRKETLRVKITAQLIDTRSGYHVWAQTVERNLGEVDEAEREIARAVAKSLGVGAGGAQAAMHAPSPEAREAYWRGRYTRGNWQEPETSLRYFERAVALDPQFAEAWAALSTSRSGLAFQAVGSITEQADKARDAARRALELDRNVAEAYITLAALAYSYDYDWSAAEQSYHRALELNPNSAGAHRAYALALSAHARFPEAVAQLKTAQELDPLSIISTNNLAVTLYLAHRYDESVKVAHQHLEMDPTFSPARTLIGNCRIEQGRWAEGLEQLQKGVEATGRPVEFLGDLGYALARAGRTAEAAAVQVEVEGVGKTRDTVGVALAKIHAGGGDKKGAIESLRHAVDTHVPNVAFIGVEPAFDGLRGEPDFQALCARLGLPNGSGSW